MLLREVAVLLLAAEGPRAGHDDADLVRLPPLPLLPSSLLSRWEADLARP